jgi:hypothetical protein
MVHSSTITDQASSLRQETIDVIDDLQISPEVYKIPQSAVTIMTMPAAYDLSADVLFVPQKSPLSWLGMAHKLRKEVQEALTV